MNGDFHRDWLSGKFEEIRRRLLLALQQLDDEHVNWRPDRTSHSIATLIRHIEGNIQERVLKGILRQEVQRNREEELQPVSLRREELERIVQERFASVIETVATITDETLLSKQQVRSRERTNLDMLHQCAAHYSEHMGQIFFIAKQLLQERYRSTSI